jgi:hypothetical protein
MLTIDSALTTIDHAQQTAARHLRSCADELQYRTHQLGKINDAVCDSLRVVADFLDA